MAKYTCLIGYAATLLAAASAQSSAAASCSPTLSASYAAPSVAEGYIARLVANNLTKPRGIKFDSQGALLVVEQLSGITALTLVDAGQDCLSVGSRKTVINDTTLNHGIEFSADGATLYASSPEAVYSWDYSPQDQTNTSEPRILVANMTTSDHTTRTLLLPQHAPGLLVVTRGSTSNLDIEAADLSTGHSQVKAFNFTNQTGPYNFNADGLLLGWGLRNDVGIAEEPISGGIYTVENSVDEMVREGQDIHENNPGEELNFLGYLNGTASLNQGRNFGYPECYSAWNASAIPDFNGTTGDQFAIGDLNSTINDTSCDAANRQAPRLTFQAHMAPLDILFNTAGTAAWVTFHGSWDRTDPAGYKVSVIEFANGDAVEPTNSTTAAVDIVSNADNSACPEGCFRPVGLAWDQQGRLFMSSDATGEIYVITRADGNETSSAGSNATGTIPTQSASGSGSGTTSSGSASASSSSLASSTESMSALALVYIPARLWDLTLHNIDNQTQPSSVSHHGANEYGRYQRT
ncbi:hypothetical protein LTR22_020405 [Elasticomyces elasticus]|nr:hypothetical protein LTR22_020405 [Elasticomyces elasticus]KAK4912169.1 hypothetical protein LTR49_019357 [Elasticomyces elasticus]KAK5747671.1 hypothetical protein LTS12_022271 [Elasticomyces elasticus]